MSIFTTPYEFAPTLLPINTSPRRCSVAFENASRRILIMRLGAHGDILMGTPFLTALRAAYPDAWITWAVERNQRDAIDSHPCVDEVLLWSGSAWKRPLRTGLFPLWLAWASRLRADLNARRYDMFISFQPEEWPLLTRAVNANISIGVFDTFRQFDGAISTSKNTRLYTKSFTHLDLPEHRADQYLMPLRALGLPLPTDKSMCVGCTQDDEDAAALFLREQGIATKEPFVIIAPMTTWPSRCWEGTRFAEFGNALARAENVRIVLIGSRSERSEVEAIAKRFECAPVVAAGTLRFRQLAALMSRATLLVSGDTGPMHLAAAVNTPYVALFGPTSIAARAPIAGRGIALAHDVPCGPCDRKICRNPIETQMLCMKLLTVPEVLDAARTLLSKATTRA